MSDGKSLAETVGRAFDTIIQKEYNHIIAPEPIVTPTGIVHLDALLGGGIISSGPVLFSSTPETGKSTFAYQFSSMFQKIYDNSIVVYIDVESSGSTGTNDYRISRIDAFGLNNDRFQYKKLVTDVLTIFELFEKVIQLKSGVEKKTGQELNVLIVWDSIAATPSSKVADAENPDKVIGTKARQLTFCLEKYSPLFKFNKITFVGIDQVRADLRIEGPFAPRKEISVGRFKNRDVKSASNTFSLQHLVQQWIFLSKGSAITSADGYGVDGWFVELYTEKNKLAPSQFSINCVFDKTYGIDKFWSEFYFLYEKTPSEKKIYKDKTNMPYPLMIKSSGNQFYLEVIHPEDPSVKYTSPKFFRKNAKKKYLEDQDFHGWFDYAVGISAQYRIVNGLFKNKSIEVSDNIDLDGSMEDELIKSISENDFSEQVGD